ncbi:hypothetical protein CEV34_3284 [Brucella pseudogrignonensis]|uniref:Uncharacterized protein n=1 Tax=Brucella pseudogrignonensis TaxID=419475 RepID=A0A256GBH1_9HYPH|nr:hypothetical protein CEV34_3284 [Brucella pseudogrignonensis]
MLLTIARRFSAAAAPNSRLRAAFLSEFGPDFDPQSKAS